MSDKIKTIYRVIKNKDFTQIHNSILHNPNLSLKAKGLIAVMLSLPDTWDFHRDHLASLSSDGKDSLKSGLQELKKARYVTINSQRDEKGRIKNWIMAVYETPEDPVPQGVYPEVDFPHVVNPPVSNTDINNNTKSSSSEKLSTGTEPEPSQESEQSCARLIELASTVRIPGVLLGRMIDEYGGDLVHYALDVMSKRDPSNIKSAPGLFKCILSDGVDQSTMDEFRTRQRPVVKDMAYYIEHPEEARDEAHYLEIMWTHAEAERKRVYGLDS